MVPLPAVALAFSIVLPPVQIVRLPEMFVVGEAFTVTTKSAESVAQPLLFVTTTV